MEGVAILHLFCMLKHTVDYFYILRLGGFISKDEGSTFFVLMLCIFHIRFICQILSILQVSVTM